MTRFEPEARTSIGLAGHKTLQLACREFFLPLMAGLLLGISFCPPAFGFIAWFALVPLAWMLKQPRLSWPLCLGTYFGGVTFFLIALRWIGESYEGQLTGAWVLWADVAAVYWLAAMLAGQRLIKGLAVPAALWLPAFWLAMEHGREIVIGFVFGDGFPLVPLGFTQGGNLRLIQSADLGGIAVISWLVACVNGALYDGFAAYYRGWVTARWGGKRLLVSAAIATTLVSASLVYGEFRLREPAVAFGPTVGMVSGSLPPPMDEQSAVAFRKRIERELAADDVRNMPSGPRPKYPSLFVWREAALGTPFVAPSVAPEPPGLQTLGMRDRSVRRRAMSALLERQLHAAAKTLDAAILVGCPRFDADGEAEHKRNSLVCFEPFAGLTGFYDKVHLAPWIEFRPEVADQLGILPSRASGAARKYFREGSSSLTLPLASPEGTFRFAPTVCYDLCFSSLHVSAVRAADRGLPLDFFVGAANERPVQSTSYPWVALRFQQFRAIECRRPYVRNAEGGITAIVDACGRTVPLLRVVVSPQQSVLIGRVPFHGARSRYVAWSNWPTIASCAVVLAILARKWPAARRARRDHHA